MRNTCLDKYIFKNKTDWQVENKMHIISCKNVYSHSGVIYEWRGITARGSTVRSSFVLRKENHDFGAILGTESVLILSIANLRLRQTYVSLKFMSS